MDKALEAAIGAIQKVYGETSIINMGDKPIVLDKAELIHSGSYKLDKALGGGYRKGRLFEIFGPESSGKTTLTLHAMAEAQKIAPVLYVDTENAFDPSYAEALGVNMSQLLISQPDFAEEAFEIIEALVSSGCISLFVLDSIAGLSPKAEMEGDSGAANVGLIARFMGQHLRKVKTLMKKTGTTGIYTNQIRHKIGNIGYGSNETTTGGNALKFFASARLDIRTIKRENEKGFNRVRVRAVKNRLTRPFQEAEFDIVFGRGIDANGEIFDDAVDRGIIEKSGSWYSYGEDRLGQGKANCLELLADNPELFNQIKEKVDAGV